MSTIPCDQLDAAAVSVHAVLDSHKLDHVFFGGYELLLLGSTRGTKDVDVIVKKPFLNGFEKVKKAFKDAPGFLVFDGNRTDGIRAIYEETSVGIDIMLENVPKQGLDIPDDANNLPFYPPTHMFLKKIDCIINRQKVSDQEDLVYLFDTFTLDKGKIKRKLSAAIRDDALARCTIPRAAQIRGLLEIK